MFVTLSKFIYPVRVLHEAYDFFSDHLTLTTPIEFQPNHTQYFGKEGY